MRAKFSIITPSFRNSEWLKLCIASVADQEIAHEHIVQDSCSDDGTQDWLPSDPRVRAFIEKDRGMYDAVNRGFRRAEGELLAYINCDEQYLPGALNRVAQSFENHPTVDVFFADAVVVNATGDYLCDRKAVIPQKWHSLVGGSLAFLTCSMFLRRRVVEEYGLFFNPALRDLGDCDWALKLIERGISMKVMRDTTTAFTDTGENMNLKPNARRESREFFDSAPAVVRKLRPAVVLHYRMRRLLSGAYRTRPYSYAIYTKQNPSARTTFEVRNPTFRWRRVPLGQQGEDAR